MGMDNVLFAKQQLMNVAEVNRQTRLTKMT